MMRKFTPYRAAKMGFKRDLEGHLVVDGCRVAARFEPDSVRLSITLANGNSLNVTMYPEEGRG